MGVCGNGYEDGYDGWKYPIGKNKDNTAWDVSNFLIELLLDIGPKKCFMICYLFSVM